VSFHHGVPITVVSSLQNMRMPTESTSRRRAEEDACLETGSVSTKTRCLTRQKGATSRRAIE
jgi:hypothetical protein